MTILETTDQKNCTGCGSCALVCKTQSISFVENELGVKYPSINPDTCINCGLCATVCHLSKSFFYEKSEEVYVAYASNPTLRKLGASGGIASVLYTEFLIRGWHVYGVEYSSERKGQYFELDSVNDIERTRNSKYLYCEANGAYLNIRKQLKNNEKVLFIGLPCQVSGLLAFLGGRCENLFLADLLCHGTCPSCYMDQHIEFISNKTKKDCESVSFRDPQFGTNRYRMTFRSHDEIIYNKGVDEDDVYQIGYHKGLIYREGCYNCRYARNERVGDLTLSDFSGIGKEKAYSGPKESISCVVVSSKKGKELFSQLVEKGSIFAETRPPEEAFNYDSMFKKPTLKHKNRDVFIREYKKNQDFENSARHALANTLIKNRAVQLIHYREIKKLARKILKK